MKKLLLTLAVTAVLAVGCGAEDDSVDTLNSGEIPVEIMVELLTPEKLNVGEVTTLEVKVTQGGEVVNDADSVEFEVWESGLRDEGTMIEGEFTEDGVYTAEYTFNHDGVYYMYAHTTARGMHIMPKQQFIVGNPDMSKVLEDNSSSSMDWMEDDSESQEHQDGEQSDDHEH